MSVWIKGSETKRLRHCDGNKERTSFRRIRGKVSRTFVEYRNCRIGFGRWYVSIAWDYGKTVRGQDFERRNCWNTIEMNGGQVSRQTIEESRYFYGRFFCANFVPTENVNFCFIIGLHYLRVSLSYVSKISQDENFDKFINYELNYKYIYIFWLTKLN